MSETKPPSRLSPGSQLGKYTIKRLLGRGRTAEVYRALDPDLARDVAIKVFHPTPDQVATIADDFRTEVRGFAALKHPNLVRIYGVGVAGNTFFVVMELIEGTVLRDKISEHPRGLGRDTTVRIFSQVASAVAVAHDRGIVHGNIKPDNVLIDKKERPVLTDFNVTCLHDPSDINSEWSPDYLSPAQVRKNAPCTACDIYALGVLLYEMITGDVPFKGNYQSVLKQHLEASPVPPSKHRVDVDPRIEQVILKAMSKNADERQTSAREMVAGLEDQGGMAQYDTISLDRASLPKPPVKTRSQIRRFQQSRIITRAGEEVEPDPLPKKRSWGRALLVVFSAVLLIVILLLAVAILLVALG